MIRCAGSCQVQVAPPTRAAVLVLALVLVASACRPAPTPEAQVAASPTSGGPAHAPEIRFGLIGKVSDENVWALFSGQGASYNNYAVRGQYWPRLFEVSIPDQEFEAIAAGAPAFPVQPEGVFYAASVPVRNDLKWTDQAPFTAEDVAFTVNTVLRFELAFDWSDFYDPGWLDHAEAAAPDTVKFYFKRAPGVGQWQYGALRGPIVQESYWAAKVAEAAEALPEAELLARIELLHDRIATLQGEVNALYEASLAAQGEQGRELQAELRRQQGNLDEATNDLIEAQTMVKGAMDESRSKLLAASDEGEPLLGRWLPEQREAKAANLSEIVNVPNPAYPGPVANFDRAVYMTYAAREEAAMALTHGKINVILDPLAATAPSSPAALTSPTRSMRLLLLAAESDGLKDATLRRAVACVVDQQELAAAVGPEAVPLTGFVATADAGPSSAEAHLPCAEQDAQTRMAQAVSMLREGGYTWDKEPTLTSIGEGLARPGGNAVRSMRLLAPSEDKARTEAARYVEQRVGALGIPVSVQVVTADDIDFLVLSTGDFDMAVVGWSVSPYPTYLCNWFGAAGTFQYDTSPLTTLCGELAVTSDLERSRALLEEIQRTLANEIPMVPLYSVAAHDILQGVVYPFSSVLDGLAGVYGAPELAIPGVP